MDSYLTRTNMLLGEDNVLSLQDKTIMVIGLGGVGGTAFEALVRSGFKKFIIVDFDKVDVTNLNRQILYTNEDVGKVKVEAARDRALKISPELDIQVFNEFIDTNSLEKFNNFKIDYIIDAIDKIPSKIAIVKFAQKQNIKFLVSLGMGNRLDPSKVMITRLDKTENDPLAKKIRSILRKEDIDLKAVNVVFSKEDPLVKSSIVSSMMMVPSTAGLIIAKYVLSTIL